MYTLNDIPIGACATIIDICAGCDMRRRLMDLGFANGTEIKCVGKSPMGDPKAFSVRGCVIALRSDDCKTVIVNKVR